MATIKNVVETRFTTKGAKKVAADTAAIGRQQTRLGQASASAGRQFSAQASGMGGLVAAYAGAAATIFALTAAFTALNRAARSEQTLAGVNALASAVGESGPKVLNMIKRITKGQLSLIQSAELANLALSSGFNTEQLAGFTEVAMRASRALGRDLTDSFQRLVKGAVKLEPELLDELGIFTRIEPAAEAYAASVGKVASQLSRFEKRQAFANAVAREGMEKYKDIDIEANTAAQSLEKLAATVTDLATNIGSIIATALAPFAEALTSPIAAIGVMGVLIKIVFGTALRGATQKLTSFNSNIRNYSDNIKDSLSSTKKMGVANLEFSKGLAKTNLNIARASAEHEKEFKSLHKKAKAQTITTAETRKYNQIVLQEIKILKQQKLALESSGVATVAQTNKIGVLTRRIAEFTTIQGVANTRLKSFGIIARTAGAAALGLGRALGMAGRFALGALGWISMIVTTLSILVTVGSTILAAFGWLDPVIEKTKAAVLWFKELLGITTELNQVRDVLKDLDTGVDKSMQLTGEIRRRQQEGRISKAMVGADKIEDALKKTIGSAGAAGFSSAEEFARKFEESLGVFGPQITDAGKQFFKKFGMETSASLRGRGLFGEATGRTMSTMQKQLQTTSGGGLQFKEINEVQESILVTERARYAAAESFSRTTNKIRKNLAAQDALATHILQSQEISVNLNNLLVAGTGTIEAIEKRRGALMAKENNLRIEAQKLREKENGTAAAALDKLADKVKQELAMHDKSAQMQLGILKIRNQIRETYSAQIKASSKLQEFYRIEHNNIEGTLIISANADEKRASRFDQLKRTYDLGAKALQKERELALENKTLKGEEAQLAAAARVAQQAITGQFLKSLEAAINLKNQIEKQLDTMKKQTALLKEQVALKKIDQAISSVQNQIKLNKIIADSNKKSLDALSKINKAKRESLNIDRTIAQNRAKDIASEFGDLLSPKKQRALELRIAQADLGALKENIEAQKKLIEDKNKIDQKLIKDQTAQQKKLIGGDGLLQQRFDQQEKTDNLKIKSDQITRDLAITVLKERKNALIEEIKMNDDHIRGMAEVLAADLVNRFHILGGQEELSDPAARKDLMKKILTTSGGMSPEKALRKKIAEVEATLGGGFGNLKIESANLAEEQGRLKTLERRNQLNKEHESVVQKINQLRQDGIITQQTAAAALLGLDNQLKKAVGSVTNLTAKFSDADNMLLQVAKDVASSISGGIVQGLRDLNTALIEGTLTMENFKQGFKDTFINILGDIQQKVFERTIVEPVESFINEKVLGAFGFGPDKKIEDALVGGGIGGTAMRVVNVSTSGMNPTELLEKSSNEAAGALDEVKNSANPLETLFGKIGDAVGGFGSVLEAAGKSVFSFLGDLFSGLGMGGGTFGGAGNFATTMSTGILGSIGNWFGSVFDFGGAGAGYGVTHGPMFAHGGLVKKMAAGGSLRDRVPTLLEPGEFVIRKPMAKAIGGPALNAMNAHGTTGTQNVVVNMNNEGTAQEVSEKPAVTVTPTAIIIDIVTRDLQTNGPIRRSIRGNLQ